MQNALNKVVKSFKDFEKFLKLKLARVKTTSFQILFEEFFRFEKTAQKVGFTYIKRSLALPNKWIKLNNISLQLGIMLFFIMEVYSFVVSFLKNDFFLTIENFMFSSGVLVVLVKVYVVFYQNNLNIRGIIEKLDEHYPHHGVDQLKYKAHDYLKILKWCEIIFYVSFTAFHIMFTLMPMFRIIFGLITSIDVEWELLVNLNLPFDQFQPFVYTLMYSFEAWVCIGTSFYVISTDLIFACLTQILVMEFDILGQVISEISMNNGEEEATKNLKMVVDIHQELIEVSEKMNEIFSPILLIDAIGEMGALCTASFLVVVRIFVT